METLETLAKILRRSEPTSAVRNLRDDVSAMLASGRATDAEIAEVAERAVALRIIRNASAIV